MGWMVWGSNPGGGEIFCTCPDRPWGPPSLLYNGYRVFSVGRKRPGRDADPSPPSSTEVWKQSRAIPLLSLRAFVAYKKGETYLQTITCKNLGLYKCCLIINLEYFIIQHLFSPMGARLKEFYCISLFLQAGVRIIHSDKPWQHSQHACNTQHGIISATWYLLKWLKKETYWYEVWWLMLCPIIRYQNSKCVFLYISGDSRVTGKTSCLWDREPYNQRLDSPHLRLYRRLVRAPSRI
jgi:hypothetical protein